MAATQSQVTGKMAHEVEFEAKKKLLQEIRLKQQAAKQNKGRVFAKDPSKGLDPKKDYIWACNKADRIVHFKSQGYTICTDPDVMTDFPVGDGTHVYADLILMEIDREYRELLKLEAQARAIENQGGADAFEAFARSSGIKAYKL